ncbi:double-strand break repair protein AddB [Microbaculum sp. FT89]|uniref:double-strand break repair protein AddB n=1 Tax=Microbaculum sp. FT89 TaxID=3447298 RepID=UPI003F53D08B
MTGPGRPRLWTVPPSAPFLSRLAEALETGTLVPPRPDGAPWPLSDYLVLLPTRRACRVLAEILAERADGGALLLPRIRPIGDIDEVELALAGAGVLGDAAAALTVPPAIGPLRRHVLLTELVLRWGRTVAQTLMVPGRDEPVAIPVVPGDAAFLARDLATLIDDFETEGRSFAGLGGLVPEDHAEYWRLTVEFLRIATELWPAILASENRVDPAARRNALLEAESRRLDAAPPQRPIIAAGSTGTIPATAGLLAAIARSPHGAVVLPGLDLDLDAESWDAIDADQTPQPGHPQYGLKRLLGRMGAVRGGVDRLVEPARPARERIVAETFRPVATTDRWAGLAERIDAADFDDAVAGVTVLEAANEQEAALSIALMMREAVETPGRTAALVTPDRTLARRVSGELARWTIPVEDSAGVPLSETPAGTVYRLIADSAALRLAPVSLVALIQHPLARFGLEADAARRAARVLELAVLRGPRPASGGQGLVRAVRHAHTHRAEGYRHPSVRRLDEGDWQGAIDLADRIAAVLAPLEDIARRGECPLADLAAAHRTALAGVVATPDGATPGGATPDGATLSGATLVGEDGEALGRFLADLDDAAPGGLSARLDQYPALLRALMSGIPVRRRAPGHPRLSILGPLEARMISADLVILGGLEEGVWPADTRTDPFLNRPMRRDVGLEAPERFIGLAAHDVAQAMCAPEIVLARSTKLGGAPAVASRWLQRFRAVVGDARYTALVARGERYLGIARAVDLAGALAPLGEPTPRPPVEARPGRLSVTEIETLIRDPYAVYARRVLRLEPLGELDEAPDARERGNIIHDALAGYVQAIDAGEPADLVAIGATLFETLDDFPEVRAFWWPRFLRVADWFVGRDAEDRAGLKQRLVEQKGELKLEIAGREIMLSGRADRFDVTDRGLRIVDYKTGTAPSDKQVLTGLSPQLPLEAAMAMNGGFGPDLARLSPVELAYVELKGSRVPGAVKTVVPTDMTVADFAAGTLASLTGLLARFADPDQAYFVKPRAQFAGRFTDYDHLSRWPEWGRLGGDGGGD